ncbi:MAG: hypothetical protein L6Q92_01675 [Phycisphaerae bacterium]|nr:hypothetical protein [Phycisphaerae bacterium]
MLEWNGATSPVGDFTRMEWRDFVALADAMSVPLVGLTLSPTHVRRTTGNVDAVLSELEPGIAYAAARSAEFVELDWNGPAETASCGLEAERHRALLALRLLRFTGERHGVRIGLTIGRRAWDAPADSIREFFDAVNSWWVGAILHRRGDGEDLSQSIRALSHRLIAVELDPPAPQDIESIGTTSRAAGFDGPLIVSDARLA